MQKEVSEQDVQDRLTNEVSTNPNSFATAIYVQLLVPPTPTTVTHRRPT